MEAARPRRCLPKPMVSPLIIGSFKRTSSRERSVHSPAHVKRADTSAQKRFPHGVPHNWFDVISILTSKCTVCRKVSGSLGLIYVGWGGWGGGVLC